MASLPLQSFGPEAVQADVSDSEQALDIRSVELLALVKEHDVSVRLRNSIVGASAARTIPFKTVGDYADAGAMAQTIMLRDVRNFGRKTARELDSLIHSVFAGHTSPVSADVIARPALDRAALLALFADKSLAELMADELLSARLMHVLAQPEFRSLTLADVLENFQLSIATMLRVPNCGRKSMNEFRAFCDRHIHSRLVESGYSDPKPLVVWLLGGPAPRDLVVPSGIRETVGELASGAVPFVDPHAPPAHDTLCERLEWLLGQLDERAATILRRRNGIDQERCETLEEIGFDMAVTRERIRQIEAKSLKRMRIRVRRAPIKPLLLAEAGPIWTALSDGEDLLRRADLHERRKSLPPYVWLALDIEERSLDGLLGEIAQTYPHGWIGPHIDTTAIEAAATMLQRSETVPLPQPLVQLVDDVPSARAAAIVMLGQPVRCDYLMPPRVGTRLTRLVRLHALLAGIGEAIPLETLVLHYRASFGDDPCSERDAEIVMDAAPHLFLEIAEGGWSAIGKGGTHFPAVEPSASMADDGFEEPGTIAHALQVTLDARGPTRLIELMDDAGDILPDGRSINSIGPVLLTRRELFVRALPGVYALPRHIPEYRAAMAECWPVLFNDYQARLYALARYAGEPRSIFPLWSAQVEYELCRWARHSGGPGILTSLLAIADVNDWPCTEEIAEEWRRLQRQEGRFELGGSLRHAAAYERPALDRVFAACRHAATTGEFNWVAGNRLTGRKIDSHGGAGLVAMLLRFGAIEEIMREGYRWQRPHRATERAAVLAAQLDRAFARAGDACDWDSEIGQDLASFATHHEADDWVDDAALSAMFSRTVDAAMLDPEDDDPLAQLLAAQRRTRECERREATLDWLLEE